MVERRGVGARRGRAAALPEPGYEPPPRLLLGDGRCVVRFATEDGQTGQEFNFGQLPVARELQVGFAVGLTARLGRVGPASRCGQQGRPTGICSGLLSGWPSCQTPHARQASCWHPIWTAIG
jgi:hypothetical protein